jgi:hypothetical protein
MIFSMIAPIFNWIICFFIPGRKSAICYRECKNKCKIMMLVQNLQSYVDPEGKTPLQTIVEKCYALGSFPALWAVEGLGKDLAETAMKRNENPVGILSNATLDEKWDGAWLMLHAGMGLGFAKHFVERLKSGCSDEEVAAMVRKVVDINKANSRPGYYGAAIESLGLVSRFLKSASFCQKVHVSMTAYAPESVGFFWRGVGRSVYFHPLNFLPGFCGPAGLSTWPSSKRRIWR